ncbi:MAG: GNAT family N-acetyltransferase [Nakamurella sp.]
MAIEVKQARDPSAVDRILRSLPDWFGIEDAIVGYVGDAAELPSYLAVVDGEVVGIALVRRHFPQSAELHLIAVAPTHHNHGVGRTLVRAIEGDLTSSGGHCSPFIPRVRHTRMLPTPERVASISDWASCHFRSSTASIGMVQPWSWSNRSSLAACSFRLAWLPGAAQHGGERVQRSGYEGEVGPHSSFVAGQ